MTHDVFISYAKEDRQVADTLLEALEAAGIRCWIAHRDLVPGRKWSGEIMRALRGAQVFLLVLSEHSDRSDQVLNEVELAVDRRLAVLTVPVRTMIPRDELAYFIRTSQWMEPLSHPPDLQLRRLVDVVRGKLSPRSGSDGPPRPPPDPAEPVAPFEVPASRGKFVALVAASAVFVVAGLGILQQGPVDEVETAAAITAIAFFGFFCVLGIRRLLDSAPALRVDERGIVDNVSLLGVGFIAWSEIADIREQRFFTQVFVAVVPRDVDAFLAKLPSWKRFFIRGNMMFGLAPIHIPQGLLPIKVPELLNRIGAHRALGTPRG
jgi:hypothetical protein